MISLRQLKAILINAKRKLVLQSLTSHHTSTERRFHVPHAGHFSEHLRIQTNACLAARSSAGRNAANKAVNENADAVFHSAE